MSQSVLFARQPIYDRQNTLHGFELLYRGNAFLPASIQGAKATTEVLVNYCTGIIEKNAHAHLPIFLNVDEAFLLSGMFIPVPPDSIVLEILETVRPSKPIMRALTSLRRQGYILALDDFVFETEKQAFFPLISIIKIDVLGMELHALEHHLAQFNFKGKTLLAEKVEDNVMYDFCMNLGFDLFQGYYLEKPTLVKGQQLTSNKHNLLNLVSNLCRDDISVPEVSDLITTDANLVIKLLKIVNCPLFPFKREVIDIKEAVIKLGLVVVKQWAVILSLVAGSSQPSELFRTLLIRAKACELYAKLLNKDNAQEFFVIGLFSGLDAVLGIDMETLVETVHFPERVKVELLPSGRDKIGVLSLIMAYENRTKVDEDVSLTTETTTKLSDAYWSGVMWTDELMEFLL
jgi:EAL and modified HD-GYP domain-containing signal transduction protein